MNDRTEMGDDSMRVVAQFLEGGAASAVIDPDAAVACLRRAADILPISDVCLGWNLPQALVDAVADETRRNGQRTWLWHPLLSGDGVFVPGADHTVGPQGAPVPWPRDMPEFAFDCPVRASGRDAALARLATAVGRAAWDGVLLDKMRWPSPTRDPIADLACFCDDCRRAAASAGVDLGAVAERVRRGSVDASARADLLRELLGIDEREPLAPFMAWRTGRVTEMVVAAADLVTGGTAPGGTRRRLGLDVYAPSLARLVGQDISGLAPLGELTKAMLYVGTHGPAGLPYEFCRLASWLAAAGVPDPVSRLSGWLGYALPPLERLCSGTLEPDVFAVELERLQQLAGPTAAAGIDAVELAGVGVLDDATLGRVARIASSSGAAIVLSWDLWAIPPRRLEAVAASIAAARPSGGAS